jgi:hypothetical protein
MENWVFLVYQLPREPSTPRISVWRKLKRLGVAQLSDGLVALPYDATTKEQLEWVAHEITESGGEASIWITTPTVKRFGGRLAKTLADERAAEYREISRQAEAGLNGGLAERNRALRRLRGEFRRIERRDHFLPPDKTEAREALERLTASLEPQTTR